eukprot:gene5880-6475_t
MRIRLGTAVAFLAGISTALIGISFYKLLVQPSHLVKSASKRKRVLFFGDSITQHGFNVEISGWVAMLAHWWSRRVDVINRGYSGYNSRWAKKIIDQILPDQRPDLIFVFFGANDAVDASVLQHVPLDEYEGNMRYIVQYIKKNLPQAALVLITPPPIFEEKLQFFNSAKGKPLLIDRTNERTLKYAEVVVALGNEYHIPVVNAWSAMEGSSASRGNYLSDGLHLSSMGCEALFNEVKKVLLLHHPEWNPEIMSMDMPEWSQFNTVYPH